MTDEAHTFSYVECDIPEDMTLDQWRRRHVAEARAEGKLARLRRRLFPPAPAVRLRPA